MINTYPRLILVGLVISSLSSCGIIGDKNSTLRSRDKDYLRSETISPLVVPDGLTAKEFEHLYPIPDVAASDEFGDDYSLSDFEVPRPDSVHADEKTLGVKIQKLSGQQWIFLGASTAQVWPRAQNFLVSTDVGVVISDAESGLIETDWLKYSDDDSLKARFRIRLEKGLHPETTEVHVLEASYPIDEPVSMPMQWPVTSTSPEREAWFLKELANHLAEAISNSSASLLGQNVGGKTKAGFVSGAPEPTMALRLPRDRAWATIIHSARHQGFHTWEKDSGRGLIYAMYDEDLIDPKNGFFRRLLRFGFKAGVPDDAPYTMEKVLNHLTGADDVRAFFAGMEGVSFSEALSKGQGYLISLKGEGESYRVVIRDHRGRRLPAREAKRLLRVLRKNLI